MINDAFAVLYVQIAKDLPGPDPSLARAQIDGEAGGGTSRPTGPMSLNNLVMDMGNGTQIPVPVTFASSEPSRPRKVGISRREVLRRAETAVARMPEAPRAIAPSSARPQLPGASTTLSSSAGPDLQHQGVDTPDERNDDSAIQEATEDGQQHEQPTEDGQGDEQEDPEDDQVDRQVIAEANEAASESVRGSLQDSADDESDLSDVPDMEDIDGSRLFPDLVKPRADHEDDHEEGDDGSENEEGDGEEGEEAEEEDGEEEGEEGGEMEVAE